MRFRIILPVTALFILAACATPGPGEAGPPPSPQPSASPSASPSPVPSPAASSKPATVQVTKSLLKELRTTYADGYLSGRNLYEYDAQGRLLLDTETNGSAVMVNIRRYQYGADGTVQMDYLDGDRLLKTRTVSSYRNGLLVQEKVLNNKDEVQSSSDYTYNAAGQKTSWIIQGKETATTASEYQWSEGLLAKVLVMDMTRAPIKNYLRTYDAAGNLTGETETDGKGTPIRKTSYVWENGRLMKETTNSPMEAVLKSSAYSYDGQGRLIRTELMNRRGEVLEIQLRTWMEIQLTVPNK